MYLQPKVPAILLADTTKDQQSKYATMGTGHSKSKRSCHQKNQEMKHKRPKNFDG